MRAFTVTAIAVLLLAGCATPATRSAGDGTQQGPRAAFDAALASNRDYREKSFVEAGFRPLAELTAERCEVRRMLLRIWLPGARPGIEIERRRDGTAIMMLVHKGEPSQSFPLPAGSWEALTAGEEAAFAKPDYETATAERMPPGIVSCHGNVVHFQATGRAGPRSAGASQCRGSPEYFTPAKQAYLERFIRLAMATRPECRADPPTPIEDAFARCFQARQKR
jgi:hypothetical protein